MFVHAPEVTTLNPRFFSKMSKSICAFPGNEAQKSKSTVYFRSVKTHISYSIVYGQKAFVLSRKMKHKNECRIL